MDLDRGTLARIDRKLLAGLGDDEAYRTVRVPATGAKWSTWKRYCDAAGVSMGRAVAMLIDRELLSVFGEHTTGEWPVFAQQATEELAIRNAKVVAREREVDTETARMAEWSERLRRWEDELQAREQGAEATSKRFSSASAARTKIGRNERCPCGSGLKYKRCHGLSGQRTPSRLWAGVSIWLPRDNRALCATHFVAEGSRGSRYESPWCRARGRDHVIEHIERGVSTAGYTDFVEDSKEGDRRPVVRVSRLTRGRLSGPRRRRPRAAAQALGGRRQVPGLYGSGVPLW